MGQKLGTLQNIYAVAYPNRASFNSIVNVICEMACSLSSMVDLFKVA